MRGAYPLTEWAPEDPESIARVASILDGSSDEPHHDLVSVLEAMHHGVLVVDRLGRVRYVNAAFGRITGVAGCPPVGAGLIGTPPGEEVARVLETGEPRLGFRTRVAGGDVEVLASVLPIRREGRIAGAVLVVQDISEVLRLSRELHRTGETADAVYEHAAEASRARYTLSDLVGSSRALQRAIHLARRAAGADSTVLLLGESGTGKELFAHAIHNASRRRAGPFIRVNCAAVPDHLLESEFFGYEKGAFTGAVRRKPGMFELAHRGTIFLDEIGEMSLPLQAKLLRVLQEQEFMRLGGTAPVRIDVRVIAATNVNLAERVAQGKFRRDLYYRLNVLTIHVPPLRERREDIPALVRCILDRLAQKLGHAVAGLTDEALALLQAYDWPGNVRELENVLERALHLMAPGEQLISAEHLPLRTGWRESLHHTQPLCTLEEMERRMIARALSEFGTSGEGKRQAAAALGISLATLYNKIKKYGLDAGTERRAG